MAGFPPRARLRKPGEFKMVLTGSTRIQEAPLTAAVKPGAADRARLGFAVSRRAVPRAVDRNRIKRHGRETFRQATLPTLDIVVLARDGAGRVPAAELRAVYDRLWKKVCASCRPAP